MTQPDPIDELTARVIRDHMIMNTGKCSCGWGHEPKQLGRLHSVHVVEKLRQVGVLREIK